MTKIFKMSREERIKLLNSVDDHIDHDINTFSMSELRGANRKLKYKYSESSLRKLSTVKKELAALYLEAAMYINIRIVSGRRSAEEQYDLYLMGRSTKDGYMKKSKHQLGEAVDSVPVGKGMNMYSGGKENELRWAYYDGFMKALAMIMNINIRSGWKWRKSPMGELKRPMSSNTLPDPNHIELV